MSSGSGKVVVYAALIGNLCVAIIKSIAAYFTGSSAMVSEAVHSFADTGNECLLLYGMHRAGRSPDSEHPLGHGRELYFWSFIVALLVFAVGAGASLYEGFTHLRHPELMQQPWVNYTVLAASLLFEGGSWIFSVRAFREMKGGQSYWQAIVRSKDPPKFTVLLEDTAAIIGILFAAAGTWASVAFHEPRFDGIASLGIGALLGTVSILLLRESKGLLIGERADPAVHEGIIAIARNTPGVAQVNGLITVQLSPDQVFAGLSLEFEDALHVQDVEGSVAALENEVRKHHPEITALFVKPQSLSTYQGRHKEAREAARD